MGPVVGKKVKKDWMNLLIEMGVVLGGVVVVGGVGLGWTLKRFMSSY
jgi:hypothetical protein